ncbi:MAG: MerR family transcriptional regulator [Candidatus Dormibacteria bacterium]
MVVAPASAWSGNLKIGEAASLTGVSPGRIRHYQARGLIRPHQGHAGYRYFDADDLVRLLQIDLLRSLGVGLSEVRDYLASPGSGSGLREALQRHRRTLELEQARLSRLLEALDQVLAAPQTSSEEVAALLVTANAPSGSSLGIFGRLSRPLSPKAAQVYSGILGGGWDLPVPSIFGRLLLPTQVSDLLEQIAAADGYGQLFERIRGLALEIVALVADPASVPETADSLADRWLADLVQHPLPVGVQAALDRWLPRVPRLALLNQGFQLWAETISPLAARFLRQIEHRAHESSLSVLGVLVASRPRPARPRRSSSIALQALPPPRRARGETESTAYIADVRSGAPDRDPAST